MVEGRRKLNLTPRELMHVHRAGIRFRSAIVVALASGSFIVRVAVTIRRVPKRHHSHCTERLRRRQQPRDEKYSATPSISTSYALHRVHRRRSHSNVTGSVLVLGFNEGQHSRPFSLFLLTLISRKPTSSCPGTHLYSYPSLH